MVTTEEKRRPEALRMSKRMEVVKWRDSIENEEILRRVRGFRRIVYVIGNRKRNCLKVFIDGCIGEVKRLSEGRA